MPRPIECRHPERASYYEPIEASLAAAGLASVDLRRYAAAAGLSPEELFLPKDSHLSAAGSALAARALAEALR